ncbi:MAG: ABC transporter substrate-binding protein [Spirochaetaceae bacterium]|nr:ABC transporter substrate-binding protein [Spirochaetaceae bacterium]
MRIVSLLPSATEILFALGAGEDLVGVTFECDFPPEARSRRIVSTSTLPDGLTPAEIDEVVAARMAAGEDLYRLDASALSDLDPDLVVTQDLCAVCAVDVSVVDDALAYLGCRAEVLTLDPQTLDEVLASVLTLGKHTGTEAAADGLVDGLRARLASVAAAVAERPPVPVLVLEWTDPPFTPGHWVPDMVEAAGGRSVLGASGQRSVRTTWVEVARAAPALVVAAPCGFDLPTSAGLARQVLKAGALPPGIPVWAVDANASFARPGPRLVEGVEALAALMHPDAGIPLDPALAERIA